MKLKDTRESYYQYTGKTSDIIRYLGLAGIAIIWIFRIEGTDKVSLPQNLLFPIILLIIGLGFDLLQYIAGSIVWGAYSRHKEKMDTKEDEEFDAPRQINWLTDTFFCLKIIPIVWAYILILKYLFHLLFK